MTIETGNVLIGLAGIFLAVGLHLAVSFRWVGRIETAMKGLANSLLVSQQHNDATRKILVEQNQREHDALHEIGLSAHRKADRLLATSAVRGDPT